MEDFEEEEDQRKKTFLDLPMGEIPEMKESFYDDTFCTPSVKHGQTA